MNRVLILFLLVTLSGCTTSYRHLSDPRVDNDGYDLFCGGWEYGEVLTISADLCSNVAPNGGEFVFVEGKYHWAKRGVR